MLSAISIPFLFLSALPLALMFVRNYAGSAGLWLKNKNPKLHYQYLKKPPLWLTVSIERIRDGRPDTLSQQYFKKPFLLSLAEETFKSEQRRLHAINQSAEEDDFETEEDRIDDLLRNELRIRRNAFLATESVKRNSYRAVAHRRLFQERSPRYRFRFPTLKNYRNGHPTGQSVMHAVPNTEFSEEVKKQALEEQKKKSQIYVSREEER